LLCGIEVVGGGVGFAGDGGEGKFGEGVADELGVDVAGAVEGGFEGEDDEHAVDALLDPAETATLPGPELRADEVDDGDVAFFQLAGEAEVDVGEVDEDGDIGAAGVDGGDEAAVFAVDVGHVPDDLGDAHVGDVFGADDAVEARGFHLRAAEAEGGEMGQAGAQLGEELRAVVVSAGFAGGEEEGRVGGGVDEMSVDSSRRDCMGSNAVKRFRAVLEPAANGLGWVVARLPFDVETAWKKKVRLRVTVEVAGEVFRTSLFVDPVRGGHFVLVNKKMQRAAGAKVGAMVEFAVAPDLEEREAELPAEFERLLKREKKLARWFGEQSGSVQREAGKWLGGVKGPEARQRRAEQMAERLMLAMEGEKVLPPVIEAAFRRRPAARVGWEAMTLTRRRGQLLGVFYYQSSEARERRVGKLVEECLKMVRR
jgi:uncharacterized protein YdeI (YjbR/CyaY-like superfamily)